MLPVQKWIKAELRRLISLLVALGLASTTILAAASPALANDPFGTLELAGTGWGSNFPTGSGVEVYSNGPYGYVSNTYNHITINGQSVNVGMEWQCVELAQRLYTVEGWFSGTFPGVPDGAYQIYNSAKNGTLGNSTYGYMTAQANGSITSIVPGDMIIHGVKDNYSPGAGHVAIVDYINGTTVHVVQQNAPVTTTYTLNNGMLTGGSGTNILGIVHSPNNTSTNAGSGNGSPPPDTDGDGVPDNQDVCPTTPGPVANRGCPDWSSRITGDFNGDGKQDIAYFYDFTNGETMLLVFTGNGDGTFTPQTTPVWDSGGQFNWNQTKVVTGDFNGDGYSDIAALYGYGGNETKLYVFYGSASGLGGPTLVWDSNGTLNWDMAKVVAGDFNGDGKTDIALFYGYLNAETVIYEFYGSSSGPTAPTQVWDSGVGNYDWNAIKPVVGDFNGDGKQDIVVFYARPSTRVWLTEFQGAATGFTAIPYIVWDSGVGGMDWNSITPVAGNFSGNTRSDIAVFYGYLNSETKLYEFTGPSGTMFSNPTLVWDSGSNNFDWNVTKPVAGDFNGDGKTDIAVFYGLPNSRVVIDEFKGAATGFTVLGSAVWDSGVNSLNWSNILVG